MSDQLPYFKFSSKDWDNGNIQLCSFESKGVFIDLCSLYWSRLGELPYKLALQKVCNGNANALQELLEEQILTLNDDQIIIDFLDEQLKERDQISSKRRDAANKRWLDANAMQVQSKSNAKRKEEKRREKKKEVIFFPWETERFITVWTEWKDYKKSQFKFSYKNAKTEQAALTELNKFAADEQTAIEIINQSIGNGWKGFFELKKNGGKQGFTASAGEYLAKNDPDWKNY